MILFSAATTATTGSTSTTSAAKPEDITWQDLENKINKWNTDIEQQVSVFIKQVGPKFSCLFRCTEITKHFEGNSSECMVFIATVQWRKDI